MEQSILSIADTAILCTVHDLCGLPVFCWEQGAELSAQTSWGVGNMGEHPCLPDHELRNMLERSMDNREAPVLFFENEFVFFGVMRWNKNFLCLGPAVRTPVPAQFETQYSTSHGLQQSIHLKRCDIGIAAKYIALLFIHCTGKPISYDEITIRGQNYSIDAWQRESALEHYQLSQSEYNRAHMSGIAFENRLIEVVRRGDVDAVTALMTGEVPDMNDVGAVAHSQHKQEEYLTVSLLTFLTRAAIEGGVHAERAYELGDVFLKELASAGELAGAYTMIGCRAMYDFTQLVKSAREERHGRSYIAEACKDYVAKDFRKNLEVASIAPAIGVSRTHLAHKFKEAEGITVQQYIQRERCRHAANLLRYSDYSIALISEYMCFSSQSYFGTCFKRWYGTTPKGYRMKHQQFGT